MLTKTCKVISGLRVILLILVHIFLSTSALDVFIGIHPHPAGNRAPYSGLQIQAISKFVIYVDNKKRPHDIMLLKLPSPVVGIEPIKLPDCATPLRKLFNW